MRDDWPGEEGELAATLGTNRSYRLLQFRRTPIPQPHGYRDPDHRQERRIPRDKRSATRLTLTLAHRQGLPREGTQRAVVLGLEGNKMEQTWIARVSGDLAGDILSSMEL